MSVSLPVLVSVSDDVSVSDSLEVWLSDSESPPSLVDSVDESAAFSLSVSMVVIVLTTSIVGVTARFAAAGDGVAGADRDGPGFEIGRGVSFAVVDGDRVGLAVGIRVGILLARHRLGLGSISPSVSVSELEKLSVLETIWVELLADDQAARRPEQACWRRSGQMRCRCRFRSNSPGRSRLRSTGPSRMASSTLSISFSVSVMVSPAVSVAPS